MSDRRGSNHTKSKSRRSPASMPVLNSLVAGIDIGSSEHWVCGPPTAEGEVNVRVFGTTTPALEALADWLIDLGVDSVAMESTYIYWVPVYELLESRGFEVLLVNARQLHNVPGRKTDMSDCQWLRLLHSCGLLRGSFRPEEAICRLRALKRQGANLVQERTRCVQWMQKSLDQMNVQVHRAVSDLTGKTGMAIVRAIVDGERDPKKLATLRDRRCRKSRDQIAEYLTGHWRSEHLFNLASALRLFDAVEVEIATYERRLFEELEALQPEERCHEPAPPHLNPVKDKAMTRRGEQTLRTALWRFVGVDLTRIDAIGVATAQLVVSEVGLDLGAFPTEKHFVSWLRLCPRRGVSGGKPVKNRRNALGANRVAGALRMASLSQQRTKTALGAYYRRVARYKGGAVAVMATARKLAVLIYRMLRYGHEYIDIGAEAYESQYEQRRLTALEITAKNLGYSLVRAAPSGG
jgi:transposase